VGGPDHGAPLAEPLIHLFQLRPRLPGVPSETAPSPLHGSHAIRGRHRTLTVSEQNQRKAIGAAAGLIDAAALAARLLAQPGVALSARRRRALWQPETQPQPADLNAPALGPQLSANLFCKPSTFVQRGCGSALLNRTEGLIFRLRVALGVACERPGLHKSAGHWDLLRRLNRVSNLLLASCQRNLIARQNERLRSDPDTHRAGCPWLKFKNPAARW
jgi:hypothetical protein